jgi:hypothetical protein
MTGAEHVPAQVTAAGAGEHVRLQGAGPDEEQRSPRVLPMNLRESV